MTFSSRNCSWIVLECLIAFIFIDIWALLFSTAFWRQMFIIKSKALLRNSTRCDSHHQQFRITCIIIIISCRFVLIFVTYMFLCSFVSVHVFVSLSSLQVDRLVVLSQTWRRDDQRQAMIKGFAFPCFRVHVTFSVFGSRNRACCPQVSCLEPRWPCSSPWLHLHSGSKPYSSQSLDFRHLFDEYRDYRHLLNVLTTTNVRK